MDSFCPLQRFQAMLFLHSLKDLTFILCFILLVRVICNLYYRHQMAKPRLMEPFHQKRDHSVKCSIRYFNKRHFKVGPFKCNSLYLVHYKISIKYNFIYCCNTGLRYTQALYHQLIVLRVWLVYTCETGSQMLTSALCKLWGLPEVLSANICTGHLCEDWDRCTPMLLD